MLVQGRKAGVREERRVRKREEEKEGGRKRRKEGWKEGRKERKGAEKVSETSKSALATE